MSDEGDEEFGPRRSEGPPTAGDAGSVLASEISRRVAAVLDAVEREAGRLREDARADATRYLDEARRQADELVAERQRRIAAVSDELLSKSEAVVSRLEDAEPVRAGFENLVRALGGAAERLARETGEGPPPPAAPPAFHETWVPPAPPPPPRPPEPAGQPAPWPGVPPPGHPPPAGPAGAPPAPGIPTAEPVAAPEPPPFSPPLPEPPPLEPPPLEPPHVEPPPPPLGPEPPRFRTARAGDPSPFAPREAGTEPPPDPEPPQEPVPQPRQWRRADDARLVAMQMAIAGNTRGEVHDHLAAVLGVLDSDRMLDEIFGPGSSPEQRLPGTSR